MLPIDRPTSRILFWFILSVTSCPSGRWTVFIFKYMIMAQTVVTNWYVATVNKMVQNGSEICDRCSWYLKLIIQLIQMIDLRGILVERNREKLVGKVQRLIGFETRPKHNDADTIVQIKQFRRLWQSIGKSMPRNKWFSIGQTLHRLTASKAENKYYNQYHSENNLK